MPRTREVGRSDVSFELEKAGAPTSRKDYLPQQGGPGVAAKPIACSVAAAACLALPAAALADVPPWVRDLTAMYEGGAFPDDEYSAALQYLLDEQILDFGEPSPDSGDVRGEVARVIDGNTLEIGEVRIRLALVDVKDSGDGGAPHAVLARLLCPEGSAAHYDVDGGQPTDRYGRTVAEVHCGSAVSLNALMVQFGLGWINVHYCGVSEFSGSQWARADCARAGQAR